MDQEKSSYVVGSVDRALNILLILEKHRRDMGVTELSKLLGVQKSTVHSLLKTLLARGFVDQTPAGRYTLGVRLIQLGSACMERMDLRTAARPVMMELANETQEVIILATLLKDELIIIDKVEPQRPFLIIAKFDFTAAIHSTAVGKVLLANAPSEVVQGVLDKGLKKYTKYTIVDQQALLAELSKIKEQGYAIGCNETIEGITCIAVPIYDGTGKVKAALSTTSASSLVTTNRYQDIITILKEKAAVISASQGYSAY